MAIECMQNCPVIKAIERNIAGNIESSVLTDFFNKGLNSAVRASDDCQGPGEKADMTQGTMQAITLAEPLKVCGWNASIQNEVILTTQ